MAASKMQAVEKSFDDFEDCYNFLIDFELFEEKELDLVLCICGRSADTLNNCVYAKYGYHDIEQYIECEGSEAEKEFWGVAQNDE